METFIETGKRGSSGGGQRYIPPNYMAPMLIGIVVDELKKQIETQEAEVGNRYSTPKLDMLNSEPDMLLAHIQDPT